LCIKGSFSKGDEESLLILISEIVNLNASSFAKEVADEGIRRIGFGFICVAKNGAQI
jgi:hypothetical protein